MKKHCRLTDVEKHLEETDFSEVSDDVIELEEGYQLVLSGWYVKIPELHFRLHEGVVGYWDEKVKEYMPDFCVTVIYPENPAEKEYLYYDILNIYYKAQIRMESDMETGFLEADLLDLKENLDAVQMIYRIREQYQGYVEEIHDKTVIIQNPL